MINFKKLIGLSLSALMMLGAAVGVKPMMERVDADNASKSLVWSEQNLDNQTSVNGMAYNLGDYFTVTVTKNSGSSAPTYYTSGAAVRCYVTKNTSNGNMITVKRTNEGSQHQAYITKVEYNGSHNKKGKTSFVYSGSPTASDATSATYDSDDLVVEASATLAETEGKENGQFYFTSITVYYVYSADVASMVDITFNGGVDSEGSMEEQSVVSGVPTKLNKNQFKMAGKRFLGWTKTQGSTNVDYIDEASITITEPLNLYAVWKDCSAEDPNPLNTNFVIGQPYKIQGKITLQYNTNDTNNSYFIQDSKGGAALYILNSVTLEVGEYVSFVATYGEYNGMKQFTDVYGDVNTITEFDIGFITDKTKVTAGNAGMLVKLENVALTSNPSSGYCSTDLGFKVGGTNSNYINEGEGADELLVSGKHVDVEGAILIYKTTVEICCYKVEETDKFTVSFNLNGGNSEAIAPQNVYPGSKVTKPEDPTKENAIFDGWYNGDQKWNFETDTVTDDVELKAKWIDNSQDEIDLQDALDEMTPAASLSYTYTTVESDKYVPATSVEDIQEGMKIAIVGKYGNKFYAFDGTSLDSKAYGSKELIGVENINAVPGDLLTDNLLLNVVKNDSDFGLKTSDNKYVGLTTGTEMKGNEEFTSVEFGIKKEPYLTVCSDTRIILLHSSLVFKGYVFSNLGGSSYASEMYILIKNSNNEKITSYKNVDFRMALGVPDMTSFASTFTAKGSLSAYGIKLSSSDSNIADHYFDFKTLDKDNDYFTKAASDEPTTTTDLQYINLILGDAINNLSRVDIEFTIEAYAVFNGKTFISQNSDKKTYSIKSMIEKYYGMKGEVKETVTPLYNLLVEKGKLPNGEEN